MNSINKAPLWVWIIGVSLFSGLPIIRLVGYGNPMMALLAAAGVFYAAGLGRAVYRQNLLARGVHLDD
ncbi:hypothetical protein ACFQO7_36875 [Catellatospora aurea]|uniref:SPW repeat-containing protein n=1 Tax=Catellatospora aurea TaxID=1337874 RepID=A0ABW2H716_9ACTN